MNVQSITAPAAMDTGTTGSAAPSNPTGSVNENQFLQLLVAQIHYQDPTNPTDSTTFVTQLAQFSSLEQLIAIRGDMDGLTQNPSSTGTTQGGK